NEHSRGVPQSMHTKPNRKTRTIRPGTPRTPADHHLELLTVGDEAEGSPEEHERSGVLPKQSSDGTSVRVVGRKLQGKI
ncbi:MAG: hypothetical protein ABJZ69_02910, partial [Hyphomicrobiales bacterium]